MKNILIILMAFLFIVVNYLRQYTDNRLIIYYLNIGQGDSILIKTPESKFVLIDTGPDSSVLFELGQVLPFWIRNIDLLIISHPDADHLRGAVAVLERYNVATVFYNQLEEKNNLRSKFDELLWNEKAVVEGIDAASDLTFGCCLYFDFVWPEVAMDLNKQEPNDTSISFVLEYLDLKAFFAGDLSSRYEEMIISRNDLKIDVLKVSHHGSKTSTSKKFLKAINPQYAVISCGLENKYKHPHPDILANLAEQGSKIFRTDLQGRITLIANDKGYEILSEKSFEPN